MANIVKIGSAHVVCDREGEEVWAYIHSICSQCQLDYYLWRDRLSGEGHRIRFRSGPDGDGARLDSQIHYQDIPVWLQMVPSAYMHSLDSTNPGAARLIRFIQKEGAEAIRRHFFGAPAGATSPPAPVNGDVFDMIIRLAQEMKQDRAELATVRREVAAVRDNACRALELQAGGERGQRRQVRVCCAIWGLSVDEDHARRIGIDIGKDARAGGWYHEVKKCDTEAYEAVNSWPINRIYPWFTKRFGPCPNPRIRDMVDRNDYTEDT